MNLFFFSTSFSLFLIAQLVIFPDSSGAIGADEICDYCQRVLAHTYSAYLQQRTKKIVKHKIHRLCNRYYVYRKRCIEKLLHNSDFIHEQIKTTDDKSYKPFETCVQLKECSKRLEKTSVDEFLDDSVIATLIGEHSSNSTSFEEDYSESSESDLS